VVGEIGIVQRQPAEGNLVPFEKAAKIEAGAVPTVSEQRDLSGVRLRRQLLQAADALTGEFVHSPHKLGRRSGDVVIKPGVDLQDSRRFGGSEASLKLRAVDERNLAEEIARQAHSKLALDAIDEFDDFDCSFEHDEQSRRLALIDRELSGIEMDVRSSPRDILQSDRRKRGKDRNRSKFVWRQHVLPALAARNEKCARLLSGPSPLCQAARISDPSSVRLTMRPWQAAMAGSMRSLRSPPSRDGVRSSSAPASRL
jgi:hypothetical protein